MTPHRTIIPLLMALGLLLSACNTGAAPSAPSGEPGVDAASRLPADPHRDAPEAREAPDVPMSGESDTAPITPPSASASSPPAASEPTAPDVSDTAIEAPTAAFEADDGLIAVDIRVGETHFAARFYPGEAGEALMALMPLTLTMQDLNRNEKFYRLPEALPAADSEQPDTILAGEIMCWSGNSLVLFYDTFANSYGGYVRLGYIEDTAGLPDTLGSGSVTMTFSLA